MVSKRGQITVFMIIGVLILISVVLFFLLKSDIVKEEIPQEVILSGQNVRNYIQSCLETTAKEAILENGFSGAYFILPDFSTTDLFDNVPYYLVLGKNLAPSDEMIAEEIGKYVDSFLDLCLDGFKTFEGYDIKEGQPSSEVKLSAKRIIVKTNLPITITIGDSTKDISKFEVQIPADQFYNNILTARKIVEGTGEEICLTCFSNLAKENDLFVNILPTFNNTYIFDIKDNNYLIKDENYHLRFAVQYEK